MRRRVVAAAALLCAAAAPAHAQWRTVTSARQLQGERQANVQVDYGAGGLTVRPAAAGLLYRMQLRYDEERTRPLSSWDARTGVLRLGVQATHRNQNTRRGGNAVVELARGVPMDLKLAFGAGDASLDLGGLSLRSLQLSTGASATELRVSTPNPVLAGTVALESGAARLHASGLGNLGAERITLEGGVGSSTLEFDGAWRRNAAVNVEMGMGAVTLRFPRDVGVRVTKDTFLTRFHSADLVKRGDAWYSRNWSAARTRVTVDVSAALGSVSVEWMDPRA
ncbi:MAG TPA: hypothetical protein VF665_16580 [Longimicrobium sp.]|jgi:hypothetical protein|uniref:hypothetical protein n=1 Tax=Longimicrobium sp. TaxID=2029185 RepID=UPI002ED929F0